jgi:hypothetical protein
MTVRVGSAKGSASAKPGPGLLDLRPMEGGLLGSLSHARDLSESLHL